MSNVKPICLVYYRWQRGMIDENKVNNYLSDKWPDYHVLVVNSIGSNQEHMIELEVYYEKDWTELAVEELKKDIIAHLDKIAKKKEDATSGSESNY